MADKIGKNPKQNYWMFTTIALAVVLLLSVSFGGFGITGSVISSSGAGDKVLAFAESKGIAAELVSIEDDGSFYVVTLSIEGQDAPVYVTKDGKYMVQPVAPLDELSTSNPTPTDIPKIPIYECANQYNIPNETIIFYYSNQCGWCTKMKPGVEALEKEGYNFKWIEGSNAEDSQLIDECLRAHMTSNGVPQFICPKTSEIHVGAFADQNGDLDQLALKTWVDDCINS